ncbi:hypothetical protein DY000_02053072 [Brassica cretica]|uniref:t-SNARE coiled-coil homology domain-containing protein n=1 Tax=Brassica cretica TaxID=69181 RepID=A0ABQ7AKQ2_BRACR|nr:hypothetical protein DY000_02053072 [Brassica cretica]
MSSSASSSWRQRTMGGEAVIDEIGKVDAEHDELVNDVHDLRQSVMKHFEFQETRLEKMEEEAMRTKMNEEMIESDDRIW